MPERIDLAGLRVGKVVVVRYVGSNKHRHSKWECDCDCGNKFVTTTPSLRKKKPTRSCGCLRPGITVDENGKLTRLYNTWNSMKSRCLNQSDKDYERYGGRGIVVCEDWLKFEPFYRWAKANGYEDTLSIERMDNDGNYEPKNCCWIPLINQAKNRRSSHLIELKGETKILTDWAKVMGLLPNTVWGRLHRGWSEEKALTTPLPKENQTVTQRQYQAGH